MKRDMDREKAPDRRIEDSFTTSLVLYSEKLEEQAEKLRRCTGKTPGAGMSVLRWLGPWSRDQCLLTIMFPFIWRVARGIWAYTGCESILKMP